MRPTSDMPYIPGIPDEARPLVDRLLREPPMPIGLLRMQVQDYRQVVHQAAREKEFVDVDLADHIADACLELLDGVTKGAPQVERRLVQVAIRYFVEEEDADDDMASIFGFDDDAAVLNAVLNYLGREDLSV